MIDPAVQLDRGPGSRRCGDDLDLDQKLGPRKA
jgi:hypothetical protein